MMHYLSVAAISDPNLPFVKKLYHDTFPANERREWEKLLVMIDHTAEMTLQVITYEEEAIGYIILWMLEDWCFIEHFAIDPSKRGRRYGEQVMKDLMEGKKLILEVEPPDADDAVRRINFYERLGLKCLPFAYSQPSYRDNEDTFRMILMSDAAVVSEDDFRRITRLIWLKVYGKLSLE